MPKCDVKRNGAISHVAVRDALIASDVPELQRTLREHIKEGLGEIVFDLDQTTMLDSSGIGLLIASYNSCQRCRGKMRLTNVPPQIMRLLESMRLVDRLNAAERATEGQHHG